MRATGKLIRKKKKQFAFLSLFLGISSVLQWCNIPGVDNTFLWWIVYYYVLVILCRNRSNINFKPLKLFLLDFLIMTVVAIIWKVQNYWDWKLLISNFFVFSLSLGAFTFSIPENLSIMLRQWFKYSWIPFLILVPFLESDAFGRYLIPFVFISMFIRDLSRKWIIVILVALFITIILGKDDRSEILKFAVSLLLGLSFMISKLRFLLLKISKYVSIVFLIMPFVLIVLGITDIFNVFKMEESLGVEGKYEMTDSKGETYSALVDTRTLLYQEVIVSSIVNDYVVFGRTPARGYDTSYFDIDLVAGRSERVGCEVGILNVYNYLGLIGVCLLFFAFVYSIYMTFNHSKNDYMKVVAIYLSFNWTYLWIHNAPSSNLNTLFIFIMMGMCCSQRFLSMYNKDFSLFIKNTTTIFN